jgi:probable HAF family extracellular repeat protein
MVRYQMMFKSFLAALALFLPVCLKAGTIYTITDLGVLAGGSITAASGISSNGLVVGSGDTDTAFSLPFLWSAGPGLSVVDPVNSQFAFGTGVNAAGVVVGYELNNDSGAFQAFVNDGSGAEDIPTLPGGANNYATAINDLGTLVGYSETTSAGGNDEAFTYSGGLLTGLGTLPGGTTSQANAINSSGHIVGQSDSSASSNPDPVLWMGSVWTDLGVPSGYQSGDATAISNADQVAGTLDDGYGGSMAFLWTASDGMTLLGALTSGGDSQAYGVNSAGLVVGTSDGVAFLYSNSAMYDLNTLLDPSSTGWQLDEAMAINDQGQIVGTGLYGDQQRAFLLTPLTSSDVPEPAALLLVGGGMLLLAAGKVRYL